ncbi:lipid-binding protein [Dyadobacter sandarakinus]|uniref:Lipid-binding protein n=2 Tax=Dyadobacter sandarakinus TaxID=2747268 RepID=A0ABX7IAG5_9BACT|nr:lipid-binding protein [Dyadobacter sandarakinus]
MAQPGGEWKFVIEKQGIRVYSRAVPDSKIKALQVKCTMPGSVAQIVALLMDLDAATKWVSHTKSCKLVRKISPSELYYYSEVSLPWPLENRDFVARIRVSLDPATRIVTVDAPAVPGWVPVRKGIVRITQSTGTWTLTPADAKNTQVQYTLQVDPGGVIPAWLVNSLSAQGPIESFTNMKEQLKADKYKNAQLPF